MSLTPCILSGGSGTRLWPVSREDQPKQFVELFEGGSLIARTEQRLRPLLPAGKAPWVITTAKLRSLTEVFYRESGYALDSILLEPQARNTAAAIALLCKRFEQLGRESEVVGVFPADHFIEKEGEFQRALELAARVAGASPRVVTLGITPTFPSTGYGYMELGPELAGFGGARRAVRFCEKPDLSTAESYIKQGNYVWNAGIFVFQVRTMIDALKKHLPGVWNPLAALREDLSNLAELYATVESVSIDYGVMEKLSDLACVPCDPGWSDVGSWDEVARLQSGVTPSPPALVQPGSRNCTVISPEARRAVALVGVEDLVVVDTPDALLVARKGQTQAVKDAHAELVRRGVPAAKQHPFETRPWGRFEILRDETHYKSKIIRVDPGHQLSYQSHAKRAEHWIIVRGEPEVVLNDVTHKLRVGESIYIPLGAKHRIRNPGREVVEFIEVQTGTYFGEDDIVRYADDYKRI
jgi:mannose-1-phosphate guanylyltransferase/mannose-1-phosphate guanylyltransferase/mannose-6-phosphate isomerase